MSASQFQQITQIVDVIERRLQEQPTEGVLSQELVEALDVVNHALCFTKHPHGLELWREALWQHRLADDARQAMIQMFEHLTAAIARGETHAVADICDCLDVFIHPSSHHSLDSESGTPVPEPTNHVAFEHCRQRRG